nr:hypothetical protein Iba_scaffold53976CG0010 [Ipomoea batatas]GME21749.1 hypothetical protein Iba_scaffold29048CG0040 [Ipomoea batatas]
MQRVVAVIVAVGRDMGNIVVIILAVDKIVAVVTIPRIKITTEKGKVVVQNMIRTNVKIIPNVLKAYVIVVA